MKSSSSRAAGPQEKVFPPAHDAALLEHQTVPRLGLIGGVVLVACMTVLALAGQSKQLDYVAYLFLGGVAPLLAASLLFMTRNYQRLAVNLLLAARLFLAFMLIGGLLLGGFEYANKTALSTSWPFLAVVFGSALAAAILCLPRFSDLIRKIALSGVLDALLIGLLVALAVFFGPFHPGGHPSHPGVLASDIVIYAWTTPSFAAWVGFGLVFTCAAIGLWRFEYRTSIGHKRLLDRLALLGVGLFVLCLFDDGLYINLAHYLVFVGPAMHAYHGGIPMVDVYSIYGMMPWIVIEAAYELLGPTFGAAALVAGLTQLATLFTMVLVLYQISRRRLAALSLMVPALLVAITFHPGLYNLNALPSTTGLRYLVPVVMVLVLTAVRSTVWSRGLGVALLVLASLWSVETFVYTLAPWGYMLLLQAVRERSIRNAGLTLLIGLAGIALGHAMFALGTLITTGQKVNYQPYFGQLARFRPDIESGLRSLPFNRNFMVWVPIWLGHFLVLSAAGYRALQGRAPTDMASRLVPVAAYGFAVLSYFMGGAGEWPSLGLAFLPIAIEMICGLEVLSAEPRRYGTIGVAALLALVLVSSVLVAFGTERFARPVEFSQGNSSVLRRCLSAAGCELTEIGPRLMRRISAAPLDPEGPVIKQLHETNPVFAPPRILENQKVALRRIPEVVDILRRRVPDQPRVVLLVDSQPHPYVSMAALMETGQWYRWPISSPLNDEISEPLVALILRRVAENPMQDGELLIVQNDRDNLLLLEQQILRIIEARCRLVPVETREFHSVFRTEACGLHQP